jgi:hypothetical protein
MGGLLHARSGGGGAVDVGGGFEMVGVGTLLSGPAGGFRASEGVVHHLFGGALGAGHFADGLLGEDGRDGGGGAGLTGSAHGLYVAWGGQSDAVAEAETGL